MHFQIRLSSFIALLFVCVSVAASAAPANSKLLALVPEGAQFVAGIEGLHNPPSKGWMLLLTRRSNLDFEDWIALTGVDPHRRADEVIEVAVSSAAGELRDHLVLLAGQFNRELIFRAALGNGATLTEYGGQPVLVVKPFTREKGQISSPRWMAILDGSRGIFGSPELVRRALDRYRRRSGPDPSLMQRLQALHKDVNSWNVLAMSAPMLARNVESEQLHAPWTHLLDRADELTLGIHYGSTDRIDFAVHFISSQKSSSLAGFLTESRLVPVNLSTSMRPRLQNLSLDQNRVRGSFLVPAGQLGRLLITDPTRDSSASNSQPRP